MRNRNKTAKEKESVKLVIPRPQSSQGDGPTTTCLVLLKCEITSPERPRCASTSSGGVSASHWIYGKRGDTGTITGRFYLGEAYVLVAVYYIRLSNTPKLVTHRSAIE
jgi:hypothetical protein